MKHTPFLFGKGLLKKELTPYERQKKEQAIKALMEQVLYRLDYLGNLYGIVDNQEEKDKVKKLAYKLEVVFSEWHINTNYHMLIEDVNYLISRKDKGTLNYQGLINWNKELLDNYFKDLKLLLKVDYSELI